MTNTPIFEWYPPRAGTTGFVNLKGWLLKIGNGGASGFCEKLVNEKEVLLLPAKMYDFEDEYVRIGFGRASLSECLVHWRSSLSNISHNRYFQDKLKC